MPLQRAAVLFSSLFSCFSSFLVLNDAEDSAALAQQDCCQGSHTSCEQCELGRTMVWFPAYPVMGTASFAGKTKKARSRCGMSTTGLDGSIIYVKHKTTALCGGFV
jgi:hypothetical protein